MEAPFAGSLDALDGWPVRLDDELMGDFLLDEFGGPGGSLPGSFAAFSSELAAAPAHQQQHVHAPPHHPALPEAGAGAAGHPETHTYPTALLAAPQLQQGPSSAVGCAAPGTASAAAGGDRRGCPPHHHQQQLARDESHTAAGSGGGCAGGDSSVHGGGSSGLTTAGTLASAADAAAAVVQQLQHQHLLLMDPGQQHHHADLPGVDAAGCWGLQGAYGLATPPAAAAAAPFGGLMHDTSAAAWAMQQAMAAAQQQQQYALSQQQQHQQQQACLATLAGGLQGVTKQTAAARQQKARRKTTVASLEADLADKLGQLRLLAAENSVLKTRAGVLEATVQNREDQMRVVWEHGPPTFPVDTAGAAAAAPAAAAAGKQVAGEAGAGGGAGQQAEAQQDGDARSAHHVGGGGNLAVLLHKDGSSSAAAAAAGVPPPPTPSARRERPAGSSAAPGSPCGSAAGDSPASSHDSASGGGSNSGGGAFDANTGRLPLPQQKDSLRSIKSMTDGDVMCQWREFLSAVTGELVALQREQAAAAALAVAAAGVGSGAGGAAGADAAQGGGGGGEVSSSGQPAAAAAAAPAAAAPVISATEQRVRDLVDRACFLVRTSQTLNPSAYCRLFGVHLDTGEPVAYDDTHWRRVVAGLGLSCEQLAHILACAEYYFSARARLQAEQRGLQAQLAASEAQARDADAALSSAADNPLRPLLDRLASNLKREHNLRILLNSYVWGRVFDHVQKAKAACFAHPLYVDIHALVCVICEDALAQGFPAAGRGGGGGTHQPVA